MTANSWLIPILIPVYLLPSIIAVARRHVYSARICLVNTLPGWTIYAWVVALVWASTAIPPETKRNSGFRSRFVSYFLPFR
jgi:hypothetical protein